MKPGDLVMVKWGESGQGTLARVAGVQGEKVRVQKWRPAVKWNEPSRDWSQPKTVDMSNVIREATDDDLARAGCFAGCRQCYGADPSCSCNPAREEVTA